MIWLQNKAHPYSSLSKNPTRKGREKKNFHKSLCPFPNPPPPKTVNSQGKTLKKLNYWLKKSPNTVYRYINSLQNLLRSKVKTFTIPGKDSHNTLSDHVAVSPVTTLCDSHIISPYNITPESHIKVARIKEMITMQLKLLIVKQILLISSLRNL